MGFSYRRGLVGGAFALAAALAALADPFSSFDPNFSQEVWATSFGFMGGVAFAPDGDVWVTPCASGSGSLRRFDSGTTAVVSGTSVHPEIALVSSNVGCGLTNHPDGSMYSNTSFGVTRQDASTGAPIGGPFGPAGNALGIAVHPLTLEVVYVGSDGTLHAIDPAFTTSATFSTVLTGLFIDGIFFDPTGAFLFTATRTGGFRVSILDGSTGALIQHVPMTSEPDGIAFHASAPKFVVTANLDGSMTRLDFPGDDFSQTPVASSFATGGFRGDLSQVGPDGCLYITQDGTNFDDGTTSSANSLVRICSGFAPPLGTGSISLTPVMDQKLLGQPQPLTASVVDSTGPLAGALVSFDVLTGRNAGLQGSAISNGSGQATFTYSGAILGTDTLQASFVDGNGSTQVSNVASVTWLENVSPTCSGKLNSLGCLPVLSWSGLPSASSTNPFDLTASMLLNVKNGVLYYGTSGGANLPFMGGTLCVSAPLQRVPINNAGGNSLPANDCSGILSFDFNSWIQSGNDPLLISGTDVDVQYWARDPADTFGFSFTGGASFTIVP